MTNANRILLYQSRVCTLKIDRMPVNLRRKIEGHESPSMYKEKHESPLIRLASVWTVLYIEKRLCCSNCHG